ncbi:protein CONSERVED IN THE GREEN LINEAGE AND DIATOMS 27, chloroplastic isoform X3 [Phoenix dactylifera]|uniref:Protein CONSERVED IN THE GREEN LINEAGE AND DIATOMS 27, chloroplastic isoform X3 n=1 Tax=Phoenix dactylifera TaxID=42345 RepID=A0A8B9A674_PHODC|nr:protein CONSERVED IN THE GREEN LINEAGE AND DIATOMS 27, chloroplastic isoform X3 [Phoenix dactylifera]
MASSLASSVFLCPLAIPKFPSPSPNPNANPNPRRRRKTSGSQSHFSPISACSASSFRNGSPPETECPVPLEQQPVNEYQALSTSFPFSWAAADLRDYCSRLALTGVSFALFVGLPVAAFGTRAVADPEVDGLLSALGTVFTGLLAVTLAVVRMYLGWAYVGNRLLSATVEYEETGWYDGQIWVKTPEVLARDRLLGSFSVVKNLVILPNKKMRKRKEAWLESSSSFRRHRLMVQDASFMASTS